MIACHVKERTIVEQNQPTQTGWKPSLCVTYPNEFRSETGCHTSWHPNSADERSFLISAQYSSVCRPNKRCKHVFPGNPAPVGRGHNLRRRRGFHGGTEDFPLNPGAKFQDLLQHRLPASSRPRPRCCWEGTASERPFFYFFFYFEGKVKILKIKGTIKGWNNFGWM